jgi:hypothetical protein
MVATDIGFILTISFFALVFFFISTQASISMCKNMGTELNNTLDSSNWFDKFQNYYGILTFKGCKDIPAWFSYVIIIPINIALVYALARLIRSGG